MKFKLVPVISAFVLLTASAVAQAPSAPPLAFEVASVKPAGPLNPQLIAAGKINIGMKVDKAVVSIGSLSLADLIRIAYKIKSYQLSGPSWLVQERFNIQAKMPDGAAEKDVPEMLQALLAERFQMKIHRETKEHSVLALVVAKGGHKMKDAPPDADPVAPDTPPAKGETVLNTNGAQVRMSGDIQGKGMAVSAGPNAKMLMQMTPDGHMRMQFEKSSMTNFVEMLTRFVGKPVVDMTGLTGNYQVAIEMTREDMMNMARAAGAQMPMGAPGGDGAKPADAASDPSGSSVFQSVQQLGLKLEPRKAPIELIVVDKIEKTPTEN